jgi:hypothetical protein
MNKKVLVIGRTKKDALRYILTNAKEIEQVTFSNGYVKADGCIYNIYGYWYQSLRGHRVDEVLLDVGVYLDDGVYYELVHSLMGKSENIYLFNPFNTKENSNG